MSLASRSRLLELASALEAATQGREVLERKRELYLEELRRRTAELRKTQNEVRPALAGARTALALARVELGRARIDAAVLAQPETASVDLQSASILGTRVPRLVLRQHAFRPAYGPCGTAASLDAAGVAFSELLPALRRLAELEHATTALRRGLRKTARRLVALERVLIPAYRAELHDVQAGLEEEERDEAVRRGAWLASRATAPES
jgi:V/A-type H+-transporting ATPase subunit D